MALVLQLSNFPASTFHMWYVIMLMLLCNSVSPGSLLDRGGSWLRSLSTLQSLDKKNPCTILILSGILRHYVCHATHTVCLIAWPWWLAPTKVLDLALSVASQKNLRYVFLHINCNFLLILENGQHEEDFQKITFFQGDVYLTAPNSDLGLAAVDELKKEGCNVLFHQLDINETKSIEGIRDE